jgi:hypothetical protein
MDIVAEPGLNLQGIPPRSGCLRAW